MRKSLAGGWWWFVACLTGMSLLLDHVMSDPIIIDLVQRDSSSRSLSGRSKREVHSASFDEVLHAQVLVGSIKQKFELMVETNWYDTWVCSIECSACNFTNNKYNSSSSKTFNNLVADFDDQISDTVINGSYASDDWSIAGLTVKNQIFGLVKNISDSYDNANYDGRLGLAPRSYYWFRFPGLMDSLYMQEKIKQRVFAIWLNKTNNTGELSIGGVNSKRFTGKQKSKNLTN